MRHLPVLLSLLVLIGATGAVSRALPLRMAPISPAASGPERAQGAAMPEGRAASPQRAALPGPLDSLAPEGVVQGSLLHQPADQSFGMATGDGSFDRFAAWLREYVAAPSGRKRDLLERGEPLAAERRAELRGLIRSDPGRALAMAVPLSVRRQLPSSILGLLERPVEGRGDLLVYCAIPASGGSLKGPAVYRRVVLAGQRFHAHVYGRREDQTTQIGRAHV